MARVDLVELLEEALIYCNADEWLGQEPEPDFHARFFARLIHGGINRFWEQDPALIATSLEERFVAAWIVRLQRTDATMLGFAMRKRKYDYLAALADGEAAADFQADSNWTDEHGAPGAIWPNLIFDEQLGDRTSKSLTKSCKFKDFVEVAVPVILMPRWNQVANCKTIMWAQHMALLEYRRIWLPKPGTQLYKQFNRHLALTDPSSDMYTTLDAMEATEETYCLQRPGLRQHEYNDMKEGRLTLGEIYRTRPAVVLRALLPTTASLN
jgi:hypothetical protein